MKKIFLIVFYLVIIIGLVSVPAFAEGDHPKGCTVMIAGKNTTVDGSVLFVKTEDDSHKEVDYLWYIPGKKYEKGAVVKLRAGGTIPQVGETYAYFWDECPGTSFSNGLVNEWGVAFGSNACRSKEDPVEEVEARGDLVNGGLGFKFRMILAERAKTAREAVMIAADLLDQYGYSASGRNLNIVGPNEAWQLQMVRGKIYVARKVQDDEVAIIANTFSIREVDMSDRGNFICSPNLINYAIKRGWYDPAGGEEFDFARAYSPHKHHTNPSNTRRQWNMARLLNKNFKITRKEAEKGKMPVSVKPDHKLSLEDVFSIFRNHYEGTELDQSEDYKNSPHKTSYTICNYTAHRTTVVQQRNWFPPEIGTLIWRCLDQPCSSVFIPWYVGATIIPEAFHKAPESLYATKRDLMDFHFNVSQETWELDMESASAVFSLLGECVDADYKKVISKVQETWSNFENLEFKLQPVIEETAFKLYQEDKALTKEFLSLYSGSQALRSLEVAKKLINEIKSKLWGGRR